jgi:hypothetical protein
LFDEKKLKVKNLVTLSFSGWVTKIADKQPTLADKQPEGHSAKLGIGGKAAPTTGKMAKPGIVAPNDSRSPYSQLVT